VGRRRRQTQRQVPDARVWYDAGGKQNFTAYKPLFTDIVDGCHVAVPRAVIAAGNVMQGAPGAPKPGMPVRRKPVSR
jgi:hypothetical protein